jgi:hypothetical protein
MKKQQEQSILSHSLLTLQVAFVAFFISSTTYDTQSFQFQQYIVVRDIMAMLLLGYGYLMTFLKSYGLGAVGFAMLLTVLAMQLKSWHGIWYVCSIDAYYAKTTTTRRRRIGMANASDHDEFDGCRICRSHITHFIWCLDWTCIAATNDYLDV